jgi:hypothetical protein
MTGSKERRLSMRGMEPLWMSFRVAGAMLLACLVAGILPLTAVAQDVNADVDASTINYKIKNLDKMKQELSQSMETLKAMEQQVVEGKLVFIGGFSISMDMYAAKFRVDATLKGQWPDEAEQELARLTPQLKQDGLKYIKERMADDEKKLEAIKAELSYLLEQRDRMSEAKWSGTYVSDDKTSTITISALGSTSLSGSDKWIIEKSHGADSWSGCTVTRNRANCDWGGTYEGDPDKSARRHGRLEATLLGDALTVTWFENEPKFTWRVSPYYSTMHEGAIWTAHYKRQ